MAAFAKDSSNFSYVACKHFVTCAINLIHYMLNKFRTKFKKIYTYIFFLCFFTEKKISCDYFWRISPKIYMVMSNLNFHKCQFNLRTINLWQHEVVFHTEVISSPTTFVRSYFLSVTSPESSYFFKAKSFIYLFMTPKPRITSSRLCPLKITFSWSRVMN